MGHQFVQCTEPGCEWHMAAENCGTLHYLRSLHEAIKDHGEFTYGFGPGGADE